MVQGTISAIENPVRVRRRSECGITTLVWEAPDATALEVRVDAPDGPVFARSGASGCETTGPWVRDGMTFYLQDVSAGAPSTAGDTLAAVTVRVDAPPSRFWRTARDLPPAPSVGAVDFGDFRRMAAMSVAWGRDRGMPIDRHYIEGFLTQHAGDIAGRLISIGEDEYARRFGGERVTCSDVLDIVETNALATYHADLTDAPQVPSNAFDCFICTQTLPLIYDVRRAIDTIYRVLKPGGVALVTVPGITATHDADWGDAWAWNFTPYSFRRLFEERFGGDAIEVGWHGNALVAVSFLMGLASSELTAEELAHNEPGFEILITVRAAKTPLAPASR